MCVCMYVLLHGMVWYGIAWYGKHGAHACMHACLIAWRDGIKCVACMCGMHACVWCLDAWCLVHGVLLHGVLSRTTMLRDHAEHRTHEENGALRRRGAERVQTTLCHDHAEQNACKQTVRRDHAGQETREQGCFASMRGRTRVENGAAGPRGAENVRATMFCDRAGQKTCKHCVSGPCEQRCFGTARGRTRARNCVLGPRAGCRLRESLFVQLSLLPTGCFSWGKSRSSLNIDFTIVTASRVPPAQFRDPGLQNPGTRAVRSEIRDPGIQDPGSKIQDPGSKIQDPGIQDPRSRIQDPGSKIQDPRSWIRDPGSWIQDPRSRIQNPRFFEHCCRY
jgi:hypothetical protein